jgi:uncharacterized membrane protein
VVGATLVEIRDRVESLSSDDGDHYVVCGRTGDRPVPVSGLRFDGRATARRAARAAEQYRAALRRYDPQVPWHDLVVCQDAGGRAARRARPEDREMYPETLRDPVVDGGRTDLGRRGLAGIGHEVAAAVLEALSVVGHDGVETAVVDAYLDRAEDVASPDDLRLCLLESVAGELDRRLSPEEQGAVLAGAATRLAPTDPADRPVRATLSALQNRGLLGSYTRSPWSAAPDGDARSVVVRLSEYALSARDGHLPVVPFVVELRRQRPDWPLGTLRATRVDGGWRLTLVVASEVGPHGVATAPIDAGVSGVSEA